MTTLSLGPHSLVFLAVVGAHLAVGIALGLLNFHALWWDARRLASGHRVGTTVSLMLGRVLLLGGALTLASLEGALPLLTLAAGILTARFVVLRGLREATP